ncbi:MAG: hypothetical protein HZA91_19575 [Verrucomicrobia bacterium]|nr:hypothetical protein [Verrucomicrobiota bacterium]
MSRKRNSARWCAGVALCSLASAFPLDAQEPQFRQFEQMRQPGTGGAPSQAQQPGLGVKPIEDDEEIGRQFLLKRRAGVPQFSFTGDAQYYYTSNRLLTENDTKGDLVFVGTAGLAWNPTWIKGVTGSVFARQQFFRYNTQDDIDFDATSFGFNAGTQVETWFNLSGGYSVTRLITRETEDEFYKEGDVSLMLHRVQMFGQRVAVPYGYTFDFFHASPGEFTRVTHGIFTGVNWAPAAKLMVQFIYRFQLEDYQSATREDMAHIVSASVMYTFTPWASARIFTSYTSNNSSIPRDYDVANGGVGVNLVLRF